MLAQFLLCHVQVICKLFSWRSNDGFSIKRYWCQVKSTTLMIFIFLTEIAVTYPYVNKIPSMATCIFVSGYLNRNCTHQEKTQ